MIMGRQKYVPNQWNPAQFIEDGRLVNGWIFPYKTANGTKYYRTQKQPKDMHNIDLADLSEKIYYLEDDSRSSAKLIEQNINDDRQARNKAYRIARNSRELAQLRAIRAELNK